MNSEILFKNLSNRKTQLTKKDKGNKQSNQKYVSIITLLKEMPIKTIYQDSKFIRSDLKFTHNKQDCLKSFRNFIYISEYSSSTPPGSPRRLFVVRNLKDGNLYFLKELDKYLNERVQNKELTIHPLLENEHILKIFVQYESINYYYIVLEYVGKGSLFDLIRSKYKTGMDEKEAHYFFIQIVSFLSYLHKNYYIHKNLRLEDFLLNDENQVKQCDFSHCVEIPFVKRTGIYSNNQNSFKANYNFEIDLSSLGTILYILLHGNYPISNAKVEIKTELSRASKDLLNRLLNKQVDAIMRVNDVINHPWVKHYQRSNISPKIDRQTVDLMASISSENNLITDESEIIKRRIKSSGYSFPEEEDDDSTLYNSFLRLVQKRNHNKDNETNCLVENFKNTTQNISQNCKHRKEIVENCGKTCETIKFGNENKHIDYITPHHFSEETIGKNKRNDNNTFNLLCYFNNSFAILEKSEKNMNKVLNVDQKNEKISNFLTPFDSFKCGLFQ